MQDQFFTFPNFENNTQCKLCLHLSVKFPAHPFCSTHSLCRAGVNSWTPSLCGACIQMCNFILSNYKESVSFKSLMFKTFDLSLNKLILVRVHPKSWSFKTDFFSTLKSICFSPNFPAQQLPELLEVPSLFLEHSQDTTSALHDTSNHSIVSCPSGLISPPLDSQGLNNSESLSFVHSPPVVVSSISATPIMSTAPIFQSVPSVDWLPTSGSKYDVDSGCLWHAFSSSSRIQDNILTDVLDDKLKSVIEIHPSGCHYKVIQDLSSSSDDSSDKPAEMLVSEAFNFASQFIEVNGLGSKCRSLQMFPNNRNILINNDVLQSLGVFSSFTLPYSFT